MPILNIRELGSIGVVSDIAPWDLPPAAFSDGMNFRLVSGKAQTAGGIEAISTVAGMDIGHITQSTDLMGSSSWLVCGEDAILLFDGTDFVALAGAAARQIKAGINVDASRWTSASIGNVTFFNNPDFNPFYWVDTDGTSPGGLQLLPWHIGEETWEDVGMSCNIMRAHKNFLFALGMKTPNGQFNDMLHWSHPAEPNGIPFSWRPTIEQPDSIAGSLSLGRGGAIVGGESLRDSFVIYSEEALNVMDFTGDALGWRRRAVSETAGLVNPHAIVEVKGNHMFFTGDDVLSFDGNSMGSLMHNRLRKRLAANLNNDKLSRSWAAHYQAHSEVWFGVPEDGADYPNRAYCFNYRDNTWSIRSLEKEVVHARAGREPKSAYLTWDKAVTRWDDELGSWTQAGDRPFKEVMFGLASEVVHDLDPTISTAGGGGVDYSGLSWDGISGSVRSFATDELEAWDDNTETWLTESRNWDDEPVEPTEKPDPPTAVVAEAGDAKAVVSWTAPVYDGGSPITEYTVTASPGGNVVTTQGDTFCTVDGLINDTEYTFTVTATNDVGESDASVPSNPVTPESGAVEPPDPEPPEPGDTSWDSMAGNWEDYSPMASYERTETVLLRTDLPIGGHEANTTITRVYPYVEGTAKLEFRFGSQQHAGGPVVWAGGYREFQPGKDRKIDVRTTGELHAYEVRSTEGAFMLTGMDIEFKPAGGR
jgi:hypothetical protein